MTLTEDPIEFYYKSTCSTCRRIRSWLKEAGVALVERDMSKHPLSVEELDWLIGDRPYIEFLNTRNALYRERNYKANPPSRSEALTAIAEEPNLFRRPLLIHDENYRFGGSEEELQRWLSDA